MSGESRMMTSFHIGARAGDRLTWPITFRPQALSLYIQFFERCDTNVAAANVTVCNLGGETGDTFGGISVRLWRPGSSDYRVSLLHSGGGTTSSVDVVGGTTYNDLIELIAQLNADGSVRIHASKNKAAVVSGNAAAAKDLPNLWHNDNLYIGHDAVGTNFGSQAIEHIAIWRGVLSLEKMRVKALAASV